MAYTDIDKSDDYFTTFLWTGNGSSTRSITGVGLQADMMWSKSRNQTHQHNLVDTVRGVNQRLLMPNETSAEDTTGTQGYFNSLDSDGFSLTLGGAGGYNTNRSGDTYVGWFWKANGSGSSNTDGSITSTVSVNTTSGFSVGTYSANATSGATVGHGLGVAPDWLMVKVRNSTNNWAVYHKSMGATKAMYLDGSSGETTDGWLNNTAPDSSVFTLSGGNYGNASGYNLVFYAFAEKKGFSKFGEYTGNGSTDGTFVYTGFKPAWVMIKKTTGDNWTLLDNKRNTYNPESKRLLANENLSEASSETLDFLSNGFKCRRTDGAENANGVKYIYMAFAENPFVTSTGTPTPAR